MSSVDGQHLAFQSSITGRGCEEEKYIKKTEDGEVVFNLVISVSAQNGIQTTCKTRRYWHYHTITDTEGSELLIDGALRSCCS